jgi:hypothetical protein
VDGYGTSPSRAVTVGPKLGTLVLAEALAIRDPAWPPLANLIAISIGLVVLSLLRWLMDRRRHPVGAARDAGPAGTDWPAVAVFLLAPVVLLTIFGGQVQDAAGVLLLNLVALVVGTWVQGGAVPMVWWTVRQVGQDLRASVALFARALPLLLISTTFLFMTGEVWQAIGTMSTPTLLLLMLVFAVLATAFLLSQIPGEVRRLGQFTAPADVVELCHGTPMAPVAVRLARVSMRRSRLRRAERLNAALLVTGAVLTQVGLVSLLVGAFFVFFGVLVVTPGVAKLWTGAPDSTVLLWLSLDGREVAITASLLRVSAFLAAFTSLSVAVSIIEDSTYRRELFDHIVADVRQALAVRLIYRALLDHAPADL